jgi:hypothetical protein
MASGSWASPAAFQMSESSVRAFMAGLVLWNVAEDVPGRPPMSTQPLPGWRGVL